MNEFDVPIFKKSCELYKIFNSYRRSVSKQDRYALWQKCDTLLLELLEGLLWASQISRDKKLPILEKTSVKLNLLRVFVRLAKETKVIDNKKYLALQERMDEIGRMLGGWIRTSKAA